MRKGSRGDNVKELQIKLNQLGYNAGTPDGIFGTRTDEAVRRFQRDNKLAIDGIVGPKTLKALNGVKKVSNYYKYNNAFVIEIDPLDLYIDVVKMAGSRITGDFINGSFYSMSTMRSISTLVSDGKVLAEQLPHDKVKRGTFLVWKDGSVSVEMIDFISKYPRLKDIKFAIGGFNMLPTSRTIRDQLKTEWFDFNLVGYRTWRSILGYSKKKNKVLVIISPNTDAEQGNRLMKNLECDIGIGLDSGASTCGRFNGLLIRNTTRIIHNIIRW